MKHRLTVGPRGALLLLPLLLLGISSSTATQDRTTSDALRILVGEATERRGSLRDRLDRDPMTFDDVDRQGFWARSVLDRLETVDRGELSRLEQQTLDILRWNSWVDTQQTFLYWYYSPLMPSRSPLRSVREKAGRLSIEDDEDVRSYLENVERAVKALDAIHDRVRGRLGRGIVLPAEQIDRVLPLIREFAALAEDHPLWLSEERLSDLDKEEKAELMEELRERIGSDVAPRAAAIANYVDQTVRRHAPEAAGWGQYPGGKEAYRTAIKIQTTLDISPEEVHEIGLAAVADLNRQMAEIRAELGFEGTKAQFHEQLRKNPRFYVDTPDAFGERLLAFDAKIRTLLNSQFGKKPVAPYTVRRLDPALESTMTYGFYSVPTEEDESGYYNYNGLELVSRSLLSAAGLTYHELVPGHHFQIALQFENEALPAFRRHGYFAGYGEGWGEYSSSVIARELGMYEDPYDLYGRLVFDMFFCVRLVVDTGMNYFGWPRQKAKDYMAEHTMESDVQIESETIRYSMRQPAQALAYRMGRETWVRLRQKAEKALGKDFDVRQFHDSALSIGSVPLTVLEEHVEWWIKSQRASEE